MKTSKENYFERIREIGAKNLSDKMQKAHDYIRNATESGSNWKLYDRNETIRSAMVKQFALLDEMMETKGSEKSSPPKKAETKSHGPVTSKQKTPDEEPQSRQVVRRSVSLPKHKSGKAVETLDPHIVLLGQYLNLSKKEVPTSRVISFARKLARQINARVLRKASKYSAHIEKMRDNIVKLVNTTKGAMAMVHISAGERKAIEALIQDEHKMRSVQLLSQYAGQAEKSTTVEKVRRLYNGMFNAIEKGDIPEDDRYFSQIIEAMKVLKKYDEKKNEKALLPLLPAELSGILGCGCEKEPEELNGIEYPETYDKEVNASHDEENVQRKSKGPIPSTEFMKQKFPCYTIAEPWVKVFGHIEPGKHTIVFSKEKLGKTTTLVDFAGYLSTHHGPVLFIQKEEELSGTFQDKFEQTQAANPNLYVDDDLPANPGDLRDYKFVFLDSVSRLGLNPKQLVALQKRLGPDTTLFAILHATKDGQHRGANEYVHDAAHIVEFPEFGAAFGKGRFKGYTGELVRFADPRE